MFRRRFAFQFADRAEDWDEMWGWNRDHHRHGHHRHGPRMFGGHMRRRFFGPGGPFGPEEPFGEEGPGRGPRFFGRGDLKYALLELLHERPMHGYEMMKALQERSGGRYSASPGSVYPTLQMLEDRGFVTVSEVEGKKVYTITDAGRGFFAEAQEQQRGPRGPGRHGFWQGPQEEWGDLHTLMHELREVAPLFGRAMHAARQDSDKRERLRKLIEQVRGELADIAGDDTAVEE
jgi:DNA-binding PadR family transcriptional regulator